MVRMKEMQKDSLYEMPYVRPAWAEVMGEDSALGGLYAEFKVDKVRFR